MVIDFHTHILPGIDDGSSDLQMSMAMLNEERHQGVDVVVLTPHFYGSQESIDHFIHKRNKAYALLKAQKKIKCLTPCAARRLLFFRELAMRTESSSFVLQARIPCYWKCPSRNGKKMN